jgi:alpha-L-rhamnosidase
MKMMNRIFFIPALLSILLISACTGQKSQISITNAAVEHLKSPIGIAVQNPKFSWEIVSSLKGISQTSYQILVADSPENLKKEIDLVWDSKWVERDNSTGVEYQGKALTSQKDYYWKVKIRTNRGDAASGTETWSTAFVKPDEWKGVWIGLDSLTHGDSLGNQTRLSARYLRKEFNVEKSVQRAMLTVSGLGLYECYINGVKVSHDVLSPSYTDYSQRVNYNVYDVNRILIPGGNAIGVVLGNGRFVPIQTWRFRNFGFPKLLLRLEIEYADGSNVLVDSDESWKINTRGPIVSNNEYDGEEYNANFELAEWTRGGYDDKEWKNARKVAAPAGKLESQPNPNITVMQEIKPVSISEIKPGCFVLDMGQNMVGWLKISLNGVKDRPVKLRFSERISDDGNINTANLRAAKAQGIYTPSKNGPFVWEPAFAYYGFRFVEVTGLDYKPSLADFTGKVVYDKMETTGSFESSSRILNQIFKNAYWGIRGNYRNGPTDCPQRDEKLFWLGDRSMNCFGESFIFDNHLLYAKWVQDIEDAQLLNGCLPDIAPYHSDYSVSQETFGSDNVTWPSTYIFACDMLYEQFGDPAPVVRHYDSMVQWIKYMTDRYLKDNILVKDQYGDWCVPPESPEIILTNDPNRKTDGAILSTTYFYRILHLMAKFSVLSGHSADRDGFLTMAENIKKAYNDKFFNKETARYGNNTVTANILSLALGLVPEGFEEGVMKNISDKIINENSGHIATGVVGTQYLMRGLTANNKADLAYRIATNTTFPSWGYMVENGATTIWELWNGNTADPGMNSHNHVMLLGDLIIWLFEDLAGIKSVDPGFKTLEMKPTIVGDLTFVKASHKSIYGTIRSEWEIRGNNFYWNISIPANTSAVVYIPAVNENEVTEHGIQATSADGVKFIEMSKQGAMFQLGSGDYQFTSSNYK